ncbi:MAG: hydrolase 2, exosortase A system-associated [Methylococcales bacterium]|nr:hydrolase 2, exosortase A system-associated [Methylococcales bacterium]
MKPLLIPSNPGSLFCIYFAPVNAVIHRAIIHIPAFAEEMNKSRRMVNLQARSLAGKGYAVLVMDLFGTGDSAGDFGDASWEIWLRNIQDAINWLKQQGAEQIDLWGLRTGNLLAMDFASRYSQQIEHLLCWHPVLNGDTFINQFLRLRIVAAVMDNNASREKTSELKQRLLNGESIEVAGYVLNPDLVKPLLALQAERMELQQIAEIAIFEVISGENAPVSSVTGKLLSVLHQKSVNSSLTRVVGDPFWASQEIKVNPELISLSTEKVAQWL